MRSKQDKVLKRIAGADNQTTDKLKAAQKAKNDEFYTPMQNISDELSHYKNKLKGKRILCPCDWDVFDGVYNITITYKEAEGKYASLYEVNSQIKKMCWYDVNGDLAREIDSDEAKKLLNQRATCNFVKVLDGFSQEVGASSITASGYNPATGDGVRFQDINYNDFDIVITNPPFSIYNEFLALMNSIREKKLAKGESFDYILLAPAVNRVTPNVGLPLMLKKCYLGFNTWVNITFQIPTEDNSWNKKIVACDWITTFDDAQKLRDSETTMTNISYDLYKDDYKIMDKMTMKNGTHPIKVSYRTIPDNYDGWMFGAVDIIPILNSNEYEWYGTSFKGYYNKVNPSANPFAHKATDGMVSINEKKLFHGIVFRKKPEVTE